MKKNCTACNFKTKYSYNIFGNGDVCEIPLCGKCRKKTSTEVQLAKKREIVAKAREAKRIKREKQQCLLNELNQS